MWKGIEEADYERQSVYMSLCVFERVKKRKSK